MALWKMNKNQSVINIVNFAGYCIGMRNSSPNYASECEAPRSRASTLMALGESADLVMVSCDHSKPRFQALLAFARSDAFARRASFLDGRDHAGPGKVRRNG